MVMMKDAREHGHSMVGQPGWGWNEGLSQPWVYAIMHATEGLSPSMLHLILGQIEKNSPELKIS